MSDEKLRRFITMLAAAGTIKLVDDSGVVQTMQITLGTLETPDKVPRLAEYGLASNPPTDTDCLTIFFGGDRNNGVVVGTNDPDTRLKNLQPGESALYDDDGKRVWLKRDGVHIDAGGKDVFIENAANVTVTASTKVVLDTPLVHCTGNVQVDGTLTASTDVIGGGKHLKTHVHSGVTIGGGNTGAPV